MSFDPNAAAAGDSGIFGLPHSPDEARVVIIPVPFDATTSYRAGTAFGPRDVLNASRQVDLFDLETGRPYEAGIAMLPIPAEVMAWSQEARAFAEPIIHAGGASEGDAGLAKVNALCERMNAWVYDTAKVWRARGKVVGLVGGDHSTPFGAIRACAEAHPGVGILHVDAHADLRRAYEGFTWSHASIMHNVAERIPGVAKIVQVGIRDFCEDEHAYIAASNGRVQTFFDVAVGARLSGNESWHSVVDSIVCALPAQVYVSFDIDGLDPTLCPHTGTPVPGGLSWNQALELLRGLNRAGKQLVGFDVNEVCTGAQGGELPDDEWDANVGARLLYKLIGWSQKS